MLHTLMRRLTLSLAAAAVVTLLSASLAAQRGAPTDVTVRANGTLVTVSWTATSKDVKNYRVLRGFERSGGRDLSGPLDALTFDDLKPVPGTTSFYQVVAWNTDGSSAAADAVAFLMPAPVATAFSQLAAVAPAPPAPPAPTALANQPSGRAPPPPPGPAPRSLQVGGNQVEVLVSWHAPWELPTPIGYVVDRWKTADPLCCRATSPSIPPTSNPQWSEVMVWPGPWTYQVTSIYADGRRGTAQASYNVPLPAPPTGLKAEQVARNTVALSWKPVQDAAYYVVSGPPSNKTFRVDSTRYTQTGIPVGNTSWNVAAMYVGKTAGAQQTSPFASISLRVVNPHFRLVAEAIRVTSETADMLSSEDGKYDEVYVAAVAETWDRQTDQLKYDPIRMSPIHGDVAVWQPSNRIKAGTASGFGGIRAGDVVSPIWAAPGDPVFVLWDGELMPGRQELLLHPTIWEIDTPDSYGQRWLNPNACRNTLCGWQEDVVRNGGRTLRLPVVKAALAASQIGVIDGDWFFGEYVHLENHDKDRPIGMQRRDNTPGLMGLTAEALDRIVIVSFERIEAALAAGQNKIQVRFWDHWAIPNTPQSTIDYLNGDYTLVIRIERMP